MSGIKTGNKGFVNPADGKVYHIDQVPVGADGVNIPENLQPIDPGDMSVDQTVKDLGKKTKLTLGTYLSNLTKGEVGSSKGTPNKYPVDAPTGSTQEFSISNEKGYPQQLAPSENSQKFDGSLQSSLSENYPGIKDAFKKGKSAEQVPDGHTLVKDVNESGSPVPAYVTATVKLNEFKPESGESFLSSEVDPTNPLPADFHPKINDVSEPGKYAGNLGDNVNKHAVTLGELRNKPFEITGKNQFPIDSSTNGLSSITDASSGFPSGIDSELKNGSFYTGEVGSEVDPMTPWKDPLIAEDFNKGKGSAGFNGNNLLLKNIPGNLNISDSRATYPSGIPDENGSYAGNDMMGSPLAEPGIVGVKNNHPLVGYEGARGGTLHAIEARGRWAPGGTPLRKSNKLLRLSDGTEVRQLQMAQVGHALMQRASGEIVSVVSGKFDPTGTGASFGSLIPGSTQLGATISSEILTAKDVFDNLDLEKQYPPQSLTSITPFGNFGDSTSATSWGASNSPFEPFEDVIDIGNASTFAAMVATIYFTFLGISAMVNESSMQASQGGKYVLGKNRFNPTKPSGAKAARLFAQNDVFGLVNTEYEFQSAFSVGMLAFFFGIDNTNLEKDELLRFDLKKVILSTLVTGPLTGKSLTPANLVVCRTIIRSGVHLANVASNISDAVNGVEATKAVANLVRTISSSKFILALNTFAKLGDSILKQYDTFPVLVGKDTKQEQKLISRTLEDGSTTTVTYYDNKSADQLYQSSVKKHRLSHGGNKNDLTLAWSTKRAPALYLVPESIVTLQGIDIKKNRLGTFSGGLGLSLYRGPNSNSRAIYSKPDGTSGDGRFSKDVLEKVEKWLDGEYVPFYFHDIRTNEVVSFHAFLTSLDDSYSASYESVDGFGRVEPIKIYKNTTRKIGISFIVAATSDDDFNHMWYKINKLLTLIYPQYTAGRTMSGNMGTPGGNTASYNFKAPFSQLIGASPVIRIRLGDLFRSNYSRFALARLFGLADGDTTIPTSEQLDEADVKAKAKAEAEAEAEAAAAAESRAALSRQVGPNPLGLNLNGLDTSKKIQSELLELKADINPGGVPTVSSTANLRDILKTSDGPTTTSVAAAETVTSTPTKQKLTISNDVGNRYDQMDAFFNADNAIVKSFESTAGKGLAGVIESMNFDWYNQTTWQTQIAGADANSIAPKMCKITISFSPIHDISPGIDHLGYNRAPVYPVGLAMANRGRSADPQPPVELTAAEPPIELTAAEKQKLIEESIIVAKSRIG